MKFLLDRFASQPERLAFVGEGSEVPYGRLLQSVQEQLEWLAETPIQTGEVVAFSADFSPEIYALILALAVSQIIPINTGAVLLIVVGAGLIGAELYTGSIVLGVGGIISMILGIVALVFTNQAKKAATSEEAQQKIVAVIRKLEDAGEIVISRGGGDDIVV